MYIEKASFKIHRLKRFNCKKKKKNKNHIVVMQIQMMNTFMLV